MNHMLCKGMFKVKEIKRKMFKVSERIFISKETGNEQLIVALVMIAIAVALILIFKEKITTLMSNFMTSVTTKINSALGTS